MQNSNITNSKNVHREARNDLQTCQQCRMHLAHEYFCQIENKLQYASLYLKRINGKMHLVRFVSDEIFSGMMSILPKVHKMKLKAIAFPEDRLDEHNSKIYELSKNRCNDKINNNRRNVSHIETYK